MNDFLFREIKFWNKYFFFLVYDSKGNFKLIVGVLLVVIVAFAVHHGLFTSVFFLSNSKLSVLSCCFRLQPLKPHSLFLYFFLYFFLSFSCD